MRMLIFFCLFFSVHYAHAFNLTEFFYLKKPAIKVDSIWSKLSTTKRLDLEENVLYIVSVGPSINLGLTGHSFVLYNDQTYTYRLMTDNELGIYTESWNYSLKKYKKQNRRISVFQIVDSTLVFTDFLEDLKMENYLYFGNNCSDFVVKSLNKLGLLQENTSIFANYLCETGHCNTPFSLEFYLISDYILNQDDKIVEQIYNL